MKTGTTYVQQILAHNRARLAEAGVLYPKPWSSQVKAVRDVLALEGGSHLGSVDGAWAGLVEQIHAWPGREVVLSMEFLSFANKKQVARIVDDFAPSDVTVVMGVRDLARGVPAQWQTSVRNGSSWSYGQFLEELTLRRPSRSKLHFWKRQDTGRIAARWADAVGAENVTVVTVPPRGAPPNLLWERMSRALEIDVVAREQRATSNESLGPTATELLRRVNAQSESIEMDEGVYQQAVNRSLSHAVLPGISEPHPPLTVPEPFHDWVRRESERVVKEITGSGVTVIGELGDLEPQLTASAFVWPEDLTAEELLGAAVEALTAYTNLVGQRQESEAGRGRTKRRRRPRGATAEKTAAG